MLAQQPNHLHGLGDASGENSVRLEDVVTTALDHHPELWKAGAVELAAGNRHPAGSGQSTEVLVAIHRQWFLDPSDADVSTGVCEPFCSFQIP